jgi:membrane associated rhomboid family serine protease
MFIPLHDGKPVTHVDFQYVTGGIIALNVLAYVLVNIFGLFGGMEDAAVSLGHVPSVATDLRVLPENYVIVPHEFYGLTAVTSAFLHVDFWHLAGNMIFLYVFADNVEDAMGHARFALFYLACIVAAAWMHVFFLPQSDAPLIGASGGAAGVVAAYLMLHPRVKLWVLFLARIPVRLRAYWLLGAWIAYQFLMFIRDPLGEIAWAAHIGGIVAGALLVLVLRRKGVPLFDRQIVLPKAVDVDPERLERARAHGIPIVRKNEQ